MTDKILLVLCLLLGAMIGFLAANAFFQNGELCSKISEQDCKIMGLYDSEKRIQLEQQNKEKDEKITNCYKKVSELNTTIDIIFFKTKISSSQRNQIFNARPFCQEYCDINDSGFLEKNCPVWLSKQTTNWKDCFLDPYNYFEICCGERFCSKKVAMVRP